MREMTSREILDEARSVQEEVENKRNEGNFEDVKKRLFEPFVRVDYQKEEVKEKDGEYEFSFSKAEMSDRDQEILLNYIRRFEGVSEAEDALNDPANWYAIGQLDYSIENTKINIFDSSLEEYKIMVCPDSKIKTGNVFYDDKIIFIAGDIATMGGLSIILHEKGHVKDKANRAGKAMFPEGGTSSESIEAEKLREEREASMYAISKMWPILRNNPKLKSDVLLYLKDMAYYSYCDDAFSNIQRSKEMEAILADTTEDFEVDEQELEERNNFSMWLNFKDSQEYVEWKKLEKFAKLEKDDEYGAWRDWIIETGKIDNEEFRKKYR